MATQAVKAYLEKTNRPYSTNDILQNLHNEWGKTAVQKSLDELVAQEVIKEKTYGKQKVYSIVQPDSTGAEEESASLDALIKEKTEALTLVTSELRQSEAALKELLSTPTNDEAEQENITLRTANEKLTKKLKHLKDNVTLVSHNEWETTKKSHLTSVKEYNKRKRICTEILDSVLEGYPKTKKYLIEEVGLETDEEVAMPKLMF